MKLRRITFLFLLSGLYLLLPLTAQAQGPDAPPSVAGGRALWSENCAPCHGSTGRGDGPTAQQIPNPLPNFTDPASARQLAPTDNFETIKNGRIENMMPPWGNRFSDAEIWDLTAQVWRLGVSPADLTTGETIYQAQCAACHGEGGAGDGPEAPADINDFTNLAAMVQLNQADLQANYLAGGDAHDQIALSETETWQTLDYIRTFSFAVPQRNGTLSGQAVNATTGETAANLAVTLRILDNNNELETLTTEADAQGNYTFTGLPTDPNLLYMVEGEYEEVAYQSEQLASFVHGSTETTLDLNVYETTGEPTAIAITQLHYIVAFAPEALTVLQIYVLGNDSNQTFVGDESGQTFTFTLPEAAQNPIFQGDAAGLRFVETDSGYADTQPIVPGDEGQVIAVSYDVPYNGEDSLTIETPLPVAAESVSLLMQERQATLESPDMTFLETRPVQGDSYALYAGSGMAPGETVTFQLNNLNELSFPTNIPGATVAPSSIDQTTLLWVIGGVGLLTVLGAGVFYPLTRPQTTVVPAEDDPERLRQKLLLLLVRLDEAFAAGEIEEGVYRQARADYKRQLAALLAED